MTTIISILNQKGGSGKTTISSNLAHAIALNGHKILLVDSDPQGSLRDWNEASGGELLPVIALDRETLPKDLKAVSDGYDFVIIDGAPQIAKMSVAAVKASNLVLIPVQPSPYDIWACADLVDIIKARQEITDGEPLAYFLISRAIKNTKLGNEVKSALVDYQLPVMKAYTTQKVAYPTTAAEGATVLSDQNSSAAREIKALLSEVMEILNYGA